MARGIDEAWQLTFADLGGLGPLTAHVVLGDPGQIAPVVTGDSRRWHHQATGPHCAAPEALITAYPDAVTRLRLPSTWRLGPATTSLIQPAFYAELPFTSSCSLRYIRLGGQVLPDLATELVNTLAGPGDPNLAAAAADRVRELFHGVVVDETGTTRALESTSRSRGHYSARGAGQCRRGPTRRHPGCADRDRQPGSGVGARSRHRHPSAGRLSRHALVCDGPRPTVCGTVQASRTRDRDRRSRKPNASSAMRLPKNRATPPSPFSCTSSSACSLRPTETLLRSQ
jgi:hypothetical protein